MPRRATATPCAEKPIRFEPSIKRPETEALRSLLALLSLREVEIARFVADGLSNKEIGQALRISHHTVSTHLRRIFSKLDVGCRIELCRIVIADARTTVPDKKHIHNGRKGRLLAWLLSGSGVLTWAI